MATKQDVIDMAFNRLGMGVAGDVIEGGLQVMAARFLDAHFKLVERESPAYWSNGGDIPQEALLPLADLLAVDIAPSFAMAAPVSRGRAVLNLLGVIRPDDRLDIPAPEYF